MKIFELIDFIQRKINSFLFRFLLLGYSIVILLSHYNILPFYTYIIGILIYFSIYIILLRFHTLRLFNDFIFIAFLILGKNPNEAIIFLFILLPVINSINFSGTKKSALLYLVTTITYIGLLCFYSKKIEVTLVIQSILPLCSLLFLWFIEFYTTLRIKIRDFREKLNEVVDSFYTNKALLNKPHKIYSKLILLINSIIRKDLISNLFCFAIFPETYEKIVFINGSKFIWQYDFPNSKFLKELREKRYQIDINLTIENIHIPYNLVLYIKYEDVEFLFVFTTKRTIPFYYVIIGFFRTLVPSLSKISKIILSENHLQEIKNAELLKLSIRSQYVTRATKAMHFIRNRLGPLNNLMKMLDNKGIVEKDKIESFELLLTSERERARFELKNIVERADYLLEKSNNPFNYTQTEKISLEKLFTLVKRNVNVFFPKTEIKIDRGNNYEKAYVAINDEGFELFLSDWLNNMKKYSARSIEIDFFVSSDKVKIIFWNDIAEDNTTINKLISDLMSNDRGEIMKRTTHGLYQIKTSLDEMNVNYEIEKVTKDFVFIKFTIELNFITDENSNI